MNEEGKKKKFFFVYYWTNSLQTWKFRGLKLTFILITYNSNIAFQSYTSNHFYLQEIISLLSCVFQIRSLNL